jgi:hypothetical protein
MNERTERPPPWSWSRRPVFDEENGARDDAIKLLPRSIDIRGAGEHDRELVILKKRQQVQVARRARGGVGRARIERRTLRYVATTTAIDFRRRNVDDIF